VVYGPHEIKDSLTRRRESEADRCVIVEDWSGKLWLRELEYRFGRVAGSGWRRFDLFLEAHFLHSLLLCFSLSTDSVRESCRMYNCLRPLTMLLHRTGFPFRYPRELHAHSHVSTCPGELMMTGLYDPPGSLPFDGCTRKTKLLSAQTMMQTLSMATRVLSKIVMCAALDC
jgi:hypothetical protein